MKPLTPPQIVQALDETVIGQTEAKQAVAVAIRNRWRSQQAGVPVPEDLPLYRYLVTGPRGAGKSMLIRQAAEVIGAPFTRVSAAQLAAHRSSEAAASAVVEALVESAKHTGEDTCAAIEAVRRAGIILIDDLQHWFHPGTDEDEDTGRPEAIARAVYRLAALPEHTTRYGQISLDEVLIFATGPLMAGKLADLSPDLQSLFPRRVDLEGLTEEDLLSILSSRAASPMHYYTALLAADGVCVTCSQDGMEAIASEAADQNRRGDDIGAHRLAQVIETVLDDVFYSGVESSGTHVTIDAAYVNQRLAVEADDEDLEDFIL